MPRSVFGSTYNIFTSIVGRVTNIQLEELLGNSIAPKVKIYISDYDLNLVCVISNNGFTSKEPIEKQIVISKGISEFEHGDIVLIEPSGRINFLFKQNSMHNTILFTEMCNHNCVMCSQPPVKDEDFSYLFEMNKKLIGLIPLSCSSLGITGGEPTLHWNCFIAFLKLISERLPSTTLHILTNGRIFNSIARVDELSHLNLDNVMLGIPLYADYEELHDGIVGSPNAYSQTVQGLHNLARFNVHIELRCVMMKSNYSRIEKFARFIYKNFPFVEHIAFMGLEPIGHAQKNLNEVWIDPPSYLPLLEKAIRYLRSLDMHVSIYNLPLCIIPSSIRKHYRKSISDWKNVFWGECEHCLLRSNCGGFFASAQDMRHNYIQPSIN